MKIFYKPFIVLMMMFMIIGLGYAQSPKINEIYSRGTTTEPDWIEIYNPSTSQVDISGYKIYDIGAIPPGTKTKKLFPTGTILPAHGFYVIITDNTGDPSDFGLSNNGETAWLEDTLGTIIDSVAFPALGVDTSYARIPNGSDTFVKLSPTTKGISNEPEIPVELISFAATISNNGVLLNWATATETNNSGFEIQRKFNNAKFEVVGFIKGFGTTTEKQNYTFVDKNLYSGNYQYRLKQIDFDGSYSYSQSIEVEYSVIPNANQLAQNYPNPFNPSTLISYKISSNSYVTIKVFDVLGNQVAELLNKYQDSGSYNIQFPSNGIQLTSGTYFYELRAGDFVSVKKMLLLR